MRRLQKRALSTLTALALVLGLFTPLGGLAPGESLFSGRCGKRLLR